MKDKDQNYRFKILVVGVGGQGVLTVAKIMGEAALLSGMPVMVGQLHGMSQRGGAVSSTIVIGPGQSAMISAKQADIVLGFETLEVKRALPLMAEHTKVIVNTGRIMPFVLSVTGKPYPELESILTEIRSVTDQIYQVDGPDIVSQVGTARSLNFIMLGALAGLKVLPFDDNVIWSAVEKRIPPKLVELNHQAFELGMASTA